MTPLDRLADAIAPLLENFAKAVMTIIIIELIVAPVAFIACVLIQRAFYS